MICYRCATPIPDDSRFCLSCGADVSGATSGERTQPVEVDAELQAKLQEDLGGDFTIERELGRGGMAAVFLARETHLERPVAIKVLPPELTYGRGMIERFKREAKVAATLDHPHIIPIHRVSTGGKIFWYAMKYLDGESLAEIIQRDAPLPLPRIADVLQQVAEALDYAHERGVIHRDVKPANVMLDARGWATVTDFGIAKAASQSSMTGSGSMIGTPYYMSPEQCSGLKITGASDQYSLGVMAFQMLTGHLPFTGQTVIEIVKKHCTDPVPPISVLRSGTSPAVIAVVERALAKTPEERFPTTGAFASAFAQAAHDEQSRAARLAVRGAAPARPRRRSITADVNPPPRKPSSVAPPQVARPLLRLGAKVAGGALLAAAMLVAMLWHPRALGPRAEPGRRAAAESVPPLPPVAREQDTGRIAAANGPALDSEPSKPVVSAEVRATRSSRPASNGRGNRRAAPNQAPRTPDTSAQAPAAPAPSSPAAESAPGSVFVWSNPPVAFTIRGQRYEINPATVTNLPAGPATITFEATDSTSAYEITVQIVPNVTIRPGRVVLPRKP